jgi:heme/copper-type cytochrome/quinol oxidase subunit 4
MMAQRLKGATAVWMLLMAATAVSWSLAEGRYLTGVATVVLIIAVAAFKVRLVFLNFMELRTAGPPWRVIFESWIIACAAVICGFYFYAPG